MSEQVPDGDFVRSLDFRDKTTHMFVEADRTTIGETQHCGGRELHRHGRNVESRFSGVSNVFFTIGKTIGPVPGAICPLPDFLFADHNDALAVREIVK